MSGCKAVHFDVVGAVEHPHESLIECVYEAHAVNAQQLAREVHTAAEKLHVVIGNDFLRV